MRFTRTAVLMTLLATAANGQWLPSGQTSGPIYYNGGYVGIGTSNPQQKLDVIGRARLTDGSSFSEIFTGSSGGLFAFHLGSISNLPLAFYTASSGPQMVLQQGTGYVGIGTSVPTQRLHVEGNIHVQTQSSAGITVSNGTAPNVDAFRVLGGATGNKLIAVLSNTDGLVYSGWLRLFSNNEDTDRVRINASPAYATYFNAGNVGIGTTAPESKLHVADGVLTTGANSGFWFRERNTVPAPNTWAWYAQGGYGRLYRANSSSSGDVLLIDADGNLTVTKDITANGKINAKYQDVAEWVPATADLSAGTVVVLDPTAANTVRASTDEYDVSVAGVVSSQPGLVLGEEGVSKEMVATMGRVRVRVDAGRSPIRIGDLLVTSDKPGLAMRSEPISVQGIPMHRPGTIIGKALECLERGEGDVLVLLSLQ